VTPEVALALLTTLAQRHPDKSPFGAYVRALPREPPDTPLMFPDATLTAILRVLPLSLVDAVDAARQDLHQLWDVAAAVMDLVRVPGAVPSLSPSEAPLELQEFFWAWMMIRSRAITFRVMRGSDGAIEGRRCMVPVIDFMNHACAPLPPLSPFSVHKASGPSSSSSSSSSSTYVAAAAAAAHRGPATDLERRANEVAWVTTRDIPAGEEVTWSYGDLSNEELWLWYGFVPEQPLHGGATVTFQLPEVCRCRFTPG